MAPTIRHDRPNGNIVTAPDGSRILCVADIRGDLSLLNSLAATTRATAVIHTGDFGFYDENSLLTISDKTLRHVIQYSPLVSDEVKKQVSQLPPGTRLQTAIPDVGLSQFPRFLKRDLTLTVPVYTVWGSCEDVAVLEKLRAGAYRVHNLHIIDEAHSRLLTVGGVKLRLFGLGGAMVMHRLFDVGDGRTTIAGGQGTMWTTVLQIGELLDTAARVYDPTETRVLVTHASPSREGLLVQLAAALKADLTISAGLHFRYGSSYNEFSVSPSQTHFLAKLAASRNNFDDVWDTVKTAVTAAVSASPNQHRLLELVLDMVQAMPQSESDTAAADDAVFKITWNFNLADAAYGSLVLNLIDGRIATEMRSEGFNFGHRIAQPAPTALLAQPAGQALPKLIGTQGPVQQQTQQQLAEPVLAHGPKPGPPVGPASTIGQVNPPLPVGPASQSVSSSTTDPAGSKVRPSQQQPTSQYPHQQQLPPPPQSFAKHTDDKPGFVDASNSAALFIRHAKDDGDALSLLADQDRANVKLQKYGFNFVAIFGSSEEMLAAFERVDVNHKGNGAGRPNVAIFRGKLNSGPPAGNGGGAGNWDSDGEYRRGGGPRNRGRGGGGGRGRGKQ